MSGPGSAHGNEAHSAHPPAARSTAEPHHVPHGYVHPKEHHHWPWYAGLGVCTLLLLLTPIIYWQYDSASAPMCNADTDTSMASPGGDIELDVVRVSCLGGGERQRIIMRKGSGGFGQVHTVVSFDRDAKIRAQWTSDSEVQLSQKGGQIATFEPAWGGVRIKYK